MNQLKKRERATNFRKSEVNLLTELVTKYRSILENKKTDAVTNKDKDAAWNKIACTFNSASSGAASRSAKTLKLKYESMKKIVKKKLTCHRQEFYKTGGGPSNAPDFNEDEEKLLAISTNISGLDSRHDSDNITANQIEMTNYDSPPVDIEYIMDTQEETTSLLDETDGSTNKWETWKPKLLKSKVSKELKPNKASVTAKLDELSSARLELVQLQQKIARAEHLFVKEEHELKLSNLRNDEIRKAELHQLMLNTMQRKNTFVQK